MSDFDGYRVPGGSYLFTVNRLARRGNTILNCRIDLLRDAVRRVRHPVNRTAGRGFWLLERFPGVGNRQGFPRG